MGMQGYNVEAAMSDAIRDYNWDQNTDTNWFDDPNKNVYKKYYVKVDGQLTKEDIEKFSEGMKMADGTEFLPGKLEILSENEGYVYIREGKFHQVKRMLAHIGKPVLYLKRVSIGNLELDPAIEKGKMKKISPEEAALVFGLKAQ